jgi:hypothetical protein
MVSGEALPIYIREKESAAEGVRRCVGRREKRDYEAARGSKRFEDFLPLRLRVSAKGKRSQRYLKS